MSLTTADIAADFELFDFIEQVTFSHRDLQGNVVSSVAVTALRRGARTAPEDGGAGSQLTTTTNKWFFQAGDLTLPAKKGDRFQTSTGEVWELSEAIHDVFLSRVGGTCRKVEG